MKANFWFLAGTTLIYGIVIAVLNKIPVVSILSGILGWGLIVICLKIHDGETAKISDLFSQLKNILKYLGSTILYCLIVLGGLILLIVPGVMWAIKYQFFSYLIVDKKMGIMEALRKSAELTKGSRNKLFGFCILMGLINIAGAIALVIGLFATIPTTAIACAYVYRKLSNGTTPQVKPVITPASIA